MLLRILQIAGSQPIYLQNLIFKKRRKALPSFILTILKKFRTNAIHNGKLRHSDGGRNVPKTQRCLRPSSGKTGRGPVALGGKEQSPDPPSLLLYFSLSRFPWLVLLIHCCCENRAEHAVEIHRNQRKLVIKTLSTDYQLIDLFLIAPHNSSHFFPD